MGFVPAKFQFYAGVGIGTALISLRGESQLDLNENEQALLEFGLLDAQAGVRERMTSFYLPVTFGVMQRTKSPWHFGYEATVNVVGLNQQV